MTQIVRKTDVFSLKSRLNCCRVCSNLLNQYEIKQTIAWRFYFFVVSPSPFTFTHSPTRNVVCNFIRWNRICHILFFCTNQEKTPEFHKHTRTHTNSFWTKIEMKFLMIIDMKRSHMPFSLLNLWSINCQ